MIRHLRQAVYFLKHKYPTPIVLVQTIDTNLNTRTGDREISETYQTVQKAVKMGITAKQKFSYDLGFVRNNVNFTYGAVYNMKDCVFLIDRKDLPASYVIHPKMHILQGSNKFMIDQVDQFDEGPFFGAYMLTCNSVDGYFPFMPLTHTLNLSIDMEVVP